MVEALCVCLEKEGFDVQHCKVMRNGDLISAFMKNFGTADNVIAVISQKYLRSPSCMTELHSIWRNCNDDPKNFQKRVHPLILKDAHTHDDFTHIRFRKDKEASLLDAQREFGADFGVSNHRKFRLVGSFAREVADMLAMLNDKVMKRDFDSDDLSLDDFQWIVDLLRRS